MPDTTERLPELPDAPAPLLDRCKHCNGAGSHTVFGVNEGPDTESFDVDCPECNGTGAIELEEQDWRGFQEWAENIDLVRWAYSKLHHINFTKQEDALMLDRMKLLLEHGVKS